MNCCNPLARLPNGEFAASRVKEGKNYVYFDRKGNEYMSWQVTLFRCRKCIHCLQVRSQEWTVRCSLESKLHKENCVLTLTYKDSPRSLSKRHVQLFLKRLRFIIQKPIKYFVAAEYGSQTMRPHYHMIIFGWKPNWNDEFVWQVKNGNTYFRSPALEKIWTHGIVTVDMKSTEQSIAYTVGYTAGKLVQQYPQGLEKPFQLMSRRPAIARDIADARAEGKMYDDSCYVNGKVKRPPGYFDYRAKLQMDEREKIAFKEHRASQVAQKNIPWEEQVEQNRYRAKRKIKEILDKRREL